MNAAEMLAYSNEALLCATRSLAVKSRAVEADLLEHLGEVDARRLYAGLGHSSMFAFCTRELGFSEDATYSRILVARTARTLPAMLEAARTGKLHMTALRLLAPHLTRENCDAVLASAGGKTKEQIMELVAKLAPQPAIDTSVRKLPVRPTLPLGPRPVEDAVTTTAHVPVPQLPVARLPQTASAVIPLAEDLYKVQLSAPRSFRDKLKQAQDLANADVLTVLSAALDLFVEKKLKDRIGAGKTKPTPVESDSRAIPAGIRHAVWHRDGGRCTFVGSSGTRCIETRGLEFDHVDGFARTQRHDVDGIRLLCRAHNQHAADELYGKEFMDRHRTN